MHAYFFEKVQKCLLERQTSVNLKNVPSFAAFKCFSACNDSTIVLRERNETVSLWLVGDQFFWHCLCR